MIASALQEVMAGPVSRTIGLTDHPFLSMFVTNLGDRPGLLIDVSIPEGATIEDGQGFDIIEVRSRTRDRLLIRPAKPGQLSPAFLGLVEFVFRETARAESHADSVTALLETVQEFRRFLARKSDRLSESAIRGLFAELQLLLNLVTTGLSAKDALLSWSGPFRGIDFTFVNASGIEVKSARIPPRKVKISSEYQLDPPQRGLHLFVLPLARVSSEDKTGVALLDLVAKTKSLLAESPDTRSLWEDAVGALGFDQSDDYYRKWSFVSEPWLAYTVLEGFPRITRDTLPDGVSSVSYSLGIDALEAYREDHVSVLEEIATVYE